MGERLIEKAPAKVNLTLRVLGRREDGLHEIESLVAFADLADTLTLETGGKLALEVSGPFAAAAGPIKNNLVIKAVAELGARVGGLRSGRFILDKRIPAAAGLGGGSSDAAAALRLLARVNGIAADDARLASAALMLGADVPVCLDPRPRVMAGIGEVLFEPLKLARVPALLVNPGVAVATSEVFAAFKPEDRTKKFLLDPPHEPEPLIEFLASYANDLSRAAISRAPAIADVLVALRGMPGCRLARMSGSGATCYGLFASAGEAAAAGKRLSVEHENWWICPVTLG